jgi:hypothetical protein
MSENAVSEVTSGAELFKELLERNRILVEAGGPPDLPKDPEAEKPLAAFLLGYAPRAFRKAQRHACRLLNSYTFEVAMRHYLNEIERTIPVLADEMAFPVFQLLQDTLPRLVTYAEEMVLAGDQARQEHYRRAWLPAGKLPPFPAQWLGGQELWERVCSLADRALPEGTPLRALVKFGSALGNYDLLLYQHYWGSPGAVPGVEAICRAAKELPGEYLESLPILNYLARTVPVTVEGDLQEFAKAATPEQRGQLASKMSVWGGVAVSIQGFLRKASGPVPNTGDDNFGRPPGYLGLTLMPETRTVKRAGFSEKVDLRNKELLWAILARLYEQGLEYYPTPDLKRDAWKDAREREPVDGALYTAIDRLKSYLEKIQIGIGNSRKLGYRLQDAQAS